MASKIVLQDGAARGVYDDRWRLLFEALSGGPLDVRRATDVEYDAITGDWVATLLRTGQVIARGKDRARVIEEEVRYLELEEIK